MRQRLMRLVGAILLGVALVGGAVSIGGIAGQPAGVQVADPGGGNGSGGGV